MEQIPEVVQRQKKPVLPMLAIKNKNKLLLCLNTCLFDLLYIVGIFKGHHMRQ